MRVALVCPYSLTVPGGVQDQVMSLAGSLRRAGVKAVVLAPADSEPKLPGVVVTGRSVRVPANGSTAPIAPFPVASRLMLAALRSEAFDVVHLHEPLVPGPCLTALLAAAEPIVGTFHRSGRGLAYRLLAPAARRASSRLASCFAVSPEAAATAASALGLHCEVLFNGVDDRRFATAPPRPTSAPTIVFVGRHEPRKGLDVLLDAFDRIPGDKRLWVVGEGPMTSRLQRRWAGQRTIEWLGRVDEATKASVIRGADVLCAPSIGGESFGVVLLEAMASGTAVVATDLPGYRRVARPGVEALLVPPRDAPFLATALERALDDRALRRRLEAAGSERAAELAVDRLAQRYIAAYDEVLGGRRPRQSRDLPTAPAG